MHFVMNVLNSAKKELERILNDAISSRSCRIFFVNFLFSNAKPYNIAPVYFIRNYVIKTSVYVCKE